MHFTVLVRNFNGILACYPTLFMITPGMKLPVIQRVFKSSYLVPRDFQTLPDFGFPLGTACFSLLCFMTGHVGRVLQLESFRSNYSTDRCRR